VDASALLTFEHNHHDARALKEDVRQLTGAKLRELAGNEAIFGIIGGPPCQGYPEKAVIPKFRRWKVRPP